MKPATGKLAELLESTVKDPVNLESSSTTQSGAGVLASAIIWPPALIEWLGIQTGTRDWFNKMLAGDPRGVCMHKDCEIYTSWVKVSVTGDSGHWEVQTLSKSEKMTLDLAVDYALEGALQPLYDVAPIKGAASPQGTITPLPTANGNKP